MDTMLAIAVWLSHTTAVIVLIVLSRRLMRNIRFLRWAQRGDVAVQHLPLVSVLVPARNESHNIRACIESLAQQEYPHLEIIVLDDQSTDDTFQQLQPLVKKYPFVRVVQGTTSPPAGWNGKSYACQRLSTHARGDWLLFTDADTRHQRLSVSSGIRQALRLNVELLSAMPRQEVKTWSEWLLVSFIMDVLPLLGIDFQRMWRRRDSQAIANGQYVLVQRDSYRALGGHGVIAGALVDDFALAQYFAQQGQRIAIVNGVAMLACHMYHNAHDVWHGFSKNIVLSLQTTRDWSLLAVILFGWSFASLFVLPYLFALINVNQALAVFIIAWLTLLRLLIAYEFCRPIAEALYTPISAIGVMALGLAALFRKRRRSPTVWKGRQYPLSP